MSMLEVKGLQKTYVSRFGGNRVEALKNVNFTVEEGEYVAIMGESRLRQDDAAEHPGRAGSVPPAASVLLDGKDLRTHARAATSPPSAATIWALCFRSSTCWIPSRIEDNIFLPLVLAGKSLRAKCAARIAPLAKQLGIDHLLKKYPYEVSGGQKQRAAVARALITEPQHPAGRRAHRRAGFPRHGRAAAPVRSDQRRRADHPDGHALRQGRQPRRARAVHQGRRGVPPALPGRLQ